VTISYNISIYDLNYELLREDSFINYKETSGEMRRGVKSTEETKQPGCSEINRLFIEFMFL